MFEKLAQEMQQKLILRYKINGHQKHLTAIFEKNVNGNAIKVSMGGFKNFWRGRPYNISDVCTNLVTKENKICGRKHRKNSNKL